MVLKKWRESLKKTISTSNRFPLVEKTGNSSMIVLVSFPIVLGKIFKHKNEFYSIWYPNDSIFLFLTHVSILMMHKKLYDNMSHYDILISLKTFSKNEQLFRFILPWNLEDSVKKIRLFSLISRLHLGCTWERHKNLRPRRRLAKTQDWQISWQKGTPFRF